MEHTDVARARGIQPVFQRDVVNKRLGIVGSIGTGRNLTAYHNLYAVVEEALRIAETVIRLLVARFGRSTVFHTHTEAGSFQSAGQGVDLALQHTVQCGTHGKATALASAAVQVDAGSHHGNGLLAALFGAHGLQFVFYGGILGGTDVEHQVGSSQTVAYGNGQVEVDHARTAAFTVRHRGTKTFGSFQIQRGVHQVATPVHITAIVKLEFLQRDDGKRIFHDTARKRVPSGKAHIALRRILQAEVATAHQLDEFASVGGQVGTQAHRIVNVYRHQHVHTSQRQGTFYRLYCGGVGKRSKGHQSAQTVFYRQR